MSDDNSDATKRSREFKLDSHESIYHKRRNTEARLERRDLSGTARISRTRRYYCVSLPATLPCVDFPQLRRLSRFFRASGFLTAPYRVHEGGEKDREEEGQERERKRERTETSERGGRDSFHINNGGSSITSGEGNGRYAETEKGAR